MTDLKIAKTISTPTVILDKTNGKFLFQGRSIPEDAVDFYKPILNWFRDYALTPNPQTCVEFRLEYFNTSSSKLILDLMLKLKNISGVSIIWYYTEDDDDMKEAGEEYSELVNFPFDIVAE